MPLSQTDYDALHNALDAARALAAALVVDPAVNPLQAALDEATAQLQQTAAELTSANADKATLLFKIEAALAALE